MIIIHVIKQWKLVALWGCLFLLSARCERLEAPATTETRDADGVITDKPYLWKSDVTGKGLIWTHVTPAIYQNTVAVAGATAQEKDMIVGLDLDTGEEVWQWADFLSHGRSGGINDSEYGINQKDNIWLLQNSFYYYAINLSTGKTIWRKKRDGQPGGIEGVQIIGNHYYTRFGFVEDSIEIPALVQGNLHSADYKKIIEPPIDSIQFFSHFYGTMGQPYVYKEENQLHAFLQFDSNVDLYEGKIFNFIASYNLSSNSYDFEKTQLGDTMELPFRGRPVMYQDVMIVNPDGELFGIDKHTGEVVWHRNEFRKNGDGVFTFALYQNHLFAVNKIGSTSRVIALNPLTGEIIWEDINRGNAAHSLHFLNGVMYFSSRGDGYLYAYDTDTGELLWQLNSPEYENFQGYGGVRAIPGEGEEKGKIIACTYATAYCYEAIR